MSTTGEGGRKRAPAQRVVGAGRATPAERGQSMPNPPRGGRRSDQAQLAGDDARLPRRAPPSRGSRTARPKPAPRNRRQRVGLALWGAAAVSAVAAVMVLFLFPTRTFFSQRHELAVDSQHVRLLNSQNAVLNARLAQLQTDAEIEAIAREQYHMVRPGERAFAILPAPSPTATAPPPATPTHGAAHHGLWQRLTSWL